MMTCRWSYYRTSLLAGLLLVVLTATLSPVDAFWSTSTAEKEEEKTKKRNLESPPETPVEYGVDVSFPIQHETVSDNYAWLPHNTDDVVQPAVPKRYRDMAVQPLGDRKKAYEEFLQGCIDKWGAKGKKRCLTSEKERFAMSLRQPQSMQNYTDVGFKKIKAPPEVFKLIKNFWEKNRDRQTIETWGMANTYTNNWVSPSSFVSVEDASLRGGGYKLKQAIWNAARDTIQEWTGQELTQCSLYGIRVYKRGSILATHVDRLPLVSSAIINVASDVEEPWPLEVYGHDGKATNVTMEPGDMVLYESHSVLHGRPFPLKGNYVANIFIHFEPTGHSVRHDAKVEAEKVLEASKDVHVRYKEATARGAGGHEVDQAGDLPSYIIPGTPEEANWRKFHPNGQRSRQRSFQTGSTSLQYAAQTGDLDLVKKHVEKDKSVVNKVDGNGWSPLHESSRGGHIDVAKYLYENGAEVNARTNAGRGATPLWWAKKQWGSDSALVRFLESVGGLEVGPEL